AQAARRRGRGGVGAPCAQEVARPRKTSHTEVEEAVLDRIDTAGKSLWQLIEERAALTPDVEMLVDMQGATLTYGEFKDRAERAAAGFAALGVTEGTPVSWILPSRKEAFVLTAALARL